jgi:molybdate/tungstate transport system substrate-binding protein
METGAIDFVFQYRSVLQQHNLGIHFLPDSLNMSKESMNDWYANGCVRIPDASQGQDITKCGESLIYGVTLPNTGKNPLEAKAFLTFMLTRGREIMVENGHPPYSLSATDQSLALPDWLKRLIEDQKEK